MADNVVLPGTGSSVATDDIDGNQFQRMKLTLGADGVNDGDVSSINPLPVAGQFYQATQPVTGPITDTELRAAPLVVTDATAAELLDGLQTLLLRLLNATNSPRGYDVGLARNRVTAALENSSATIGQVNISAAQTLAALTNITNMGGTQAQLLSNGQNVSAWAATVRARIT